MGYRLCECLPFYGCWVGTSIGHYICIPQGILLEGGHFNRSVIMWQVLFSDVANGRKDTKHGDHSQFFAKFPARWPFKAHIRSEKTNALDLARTVAANSCYLSKFNKLTDYMALYIPKGRSVWPHFTHDGRSSVADILLI